MGGMEKLFRLLFPSLFFSVRPRRRRHRVPQGNPFLLLSSGPSRKEKKISDKRKILLLLLLLLFLHPLERPSFPFCPPSGGRTQGGAPPTGERLRSGRFGRTLEEEDSTRHLFFCSAYPVPQEMGSLKSESSFGVLLGATGRQGMCLLWVFFLAAPC